MDTQQLFQQSTELSAKGYNKRSSEHLNLYGKKDFDKIIHKEYLSHEDINNLKGLEVELIFNWKLGDLLVFDRSNLHCSSKNINIKKLASQAQQKNMKLIDCFMYFDEISLRLRLNTLYDKVDVHNC